MAKARQIRRRTVASARVLGVPAREAAAAGNRRPTPGGGR
jgi:hypothetical protein